MSKAQSDAVLDAMIRQAGISWDIPEEIESLLMELRDRRLADLSPEEVHSLAFVIGSGGRVTPEQGSAAWRALAKIYRRKP